MDATKIIFHFVILLQFNLLTLLSASENAPPAEEKKTSNPKADLTKYFQDLQAGKAVSINASIVRREKIFADDAAAELPRSRNGTLVEAIPLSGSCVLETCQLDEQVCCAPVFRLTRDSNSEYCCHPEHQNMAMKITSVTIGLIIVLICVFTIFKYVKVKYTERRRRDEVTREREAGPPPFDIAVNMNQLHPPSYNECMGINFNKYTLQHSGSDQNISGSRSDQVDDIKEDKKVEVEDPEHPSPPYSERITNGGHGSETEFSSTEKSYQKLNQFIKERKF